MADDARHGSHHGDLIESLDALQGEIEGVVADESQRPLRAKLVVLLLRLAPSTAARALRGCDVVEAVGAPFAVAAVVDAFDDVDGDPVAERWSAVLLDLTLPSAYAFFGFDDETPIAARAKAFAVRVNGVASEALRSGLLGRFFFGRGPREPSDGATANVLGVLVNVLSYASQFQSKLRQHLVDGACRDLVPKVVLPLLGRSCDRAARDAEAWPRLLLALRLLVVATFKLKKCRRDVCDNNPTRRCVDVVEADATEGRLRGVGALLALLVKLNVNVEGGFGPHWLATARENAAAIADCADRASPTARRMFRRHLALHDGVPVNRGSRAWRVVVDAVLKAEPPSPDAKDSKGGSTPPASPQRRPPGTPAASPVSWDPQPRRDLDDLSTALRRALGDESDPDSPPAAKRADRPCAWTPHRLPPLAGAPTDAAATHFVAFPGPGARAAPAEDLRCALSGALMDEPVPIPGTDRAVDRAALADHLDDARRWPVTGAPFAGDVDDLAVDDKLQRKIAAFKFASLVASPQRPEPRRP